MFAVPRPILTSVAVGVIAIGGLAAMGQLPRAIADEAKVSSVLKLPGTQVGTSIDPGDLVIFGDDRYLVSIAPSVSTEAISKTVVEKIAFGRHTDVNIVTTSSGTYSSDAIYSPNVMYPGIRVSRAASDNVAAVLTYKLDNGAWVKLPLLSGNSFVTAVPTPNGTMVLTGDCLISARVAVC